MNELEKEGVAHILRALSAKDVFSILDTTTKHMVKAENVEEAITIILTYSESASTALRRKKIKKQTLFNYLRFHNVVVSINGEKIDYIKACLRLWNSNDVDKVQSYTDIEELEYNPSIEVAQVSPNTCTNAREVQQLGSQFSTWFFENLNSLRDFGPHHFWPDSKLWLYTKFRESNDECCVVGADQVASYFISFVQNRSFYFQPNIQTVESKEEEHGLVRVCACGIIHQQANCIGLFDATFGLANDPVSDYKWKIMVIYLKLQINDCSPIYASNGTTAQYLCQ